MLTVKQIEAAKPKEKPYRLLDGNGLYLYVPVSGKKVWQLRYKIDGKEKILTVGKYPLMTLQEARDKAWTARKDISVGIVPVKAKKASSNNNSFSAIYKEWYEHKKQVWSVGYATELAKMFDDDILPIIGGLEIQDIEPMQLLEVIRRFEDRGAMERANKARRRCGEVFRYAIVTGRAKYNPAPDLADAMKGYRKKNFPFLPADQMPAFNKALATFSGSIVSLIATKVLRYTALRTKELRSMLWKNVDFENRIITIDASVMKGRKIHVVPMSDQVVELLTTLSSITKVPEQSIQWLTDNGSAYRAHETRQFARELNLEPCTTAISSPQSNGMAERFVKTMKEDYIAFMPKPNVRTALHNLAVAIEHYNENHPHSALGYRSPREYRRQRVTLT